MIFKLFLILPLRCGIAIIGDLLLLCDLWNLPVKAFFGPEARLTIRLWAGIDPMARCEIGAHPIGEQCLLEFFVRLQVRRAILSLLALVLAPVLIGVLAARHRQPRCVAQRTIWGASRTAAVIWLDATKSAVVTGVVVVGLPIVSIRRLGLQLACVFFLSLSLGFQLAHHLAQLCDAGPATAIASAGGMTGQRHTVVVVVVVVRGIFTTPRQCSASIMRCQLRHHAGRHICAFLRRRRSSPLVCKHTPFLG